MQRLRNAASVSLLMALFFSPFQSRIVRGQRAERRFEGGAVSGQGPARRVATGSLPPPQFADPERVRKLTTAFPEIEQLFNKWFADRHVPGAVLGIIVDG